MLVTMPTRLNLILDPIAMSQNLKIGHSIASEERNWFQSKSPSFRGLDYARVGFKLGSCLVHELGYFEGFVSA